jgi:prophage regulatory protein
MSAKLLRFSDLKPEKGIPWSRMHLDRLEKAGKFPRRIKLSPNAVAWFESEVDEFLSAKAAERVPA